MSADKKLVVITGASSGFGLELAKQLNQLGHPLLLLARRLEKMESLQLSNCICKKVDVTNLQDFQDAIAFAEKHFNLSVDCLVNNAGVSHMHSMYAQPTSEWNNMVDINIKGVLNGINAALPSMKKNKIGTIINISSVAGRVNVPMATVYCGTKFAVHAISAGLRAEVAPDNIRVITISPGAAATELINNITSNKELQDSIMERVNNSTGDIMTAEDVVNTIIFAYKLPQKLCIHELAIAPTHW